MNKEEQKAEAEAVKQALIETVKLLGKSLGDDVSVECSDNHEKDIIIRKKNVVTVYVFGSYFESKPINVWMKRKTEFGGYKTVKKYGPGSRRDIRKFTTKDPFGVVHFIKSKLDEWKPVKKTRQHKKLDPVGEIQNVIATMLKEKGARITQYARSSTGYSTVQMCRMEVLTYENKIIVILGHITKSKGKRIVIDFDVNKPDFDPEGLVAQITKVGKDIEKIILDAANKHKSYLEDIKIV